MTRSVVATSSSCKVDADEMAELWRPVRYLPGEALLALYRRGGPGIDYGFGGHGYVSVLGPDANKFVVANSDAFSWWEAMQSLAPVDGSTALILGDGADHRRRRSPVQPALLLLPSGGTCGRRASRPTARSVSPGRGCRPRPEALCGPI